MPPAAMSSPLPRAYLVAGKHPELLRASTAPGDLNPRTLRVDLASPPHGQGNSDPSAEEERGAEEEHQVRPEEAETSCVLGRQLPLDAPSGEHPDEKAAESEKQSELKEGGVSTRRVVGWIDGEHHEEQEE
jgi:hypothetical protein